MKNYLKDQINQIKYGNLKTIKYKFKRILFWISFALVKFLTIPAFFFIRIFSNFILIRFGSFNSTRIGHFANDIHFYLINLKKKDKKVLDLFYFPKPISNIELAKLFKKFLIVLPEFFILSLIYLNKIKFIGNPKHNFIISNFSGSMPLYEENDTKQIKYFNSKELIHGKNFLKELGLNADDKYICLLCRDTEYENYLHKKNYNWKFVQNRILDPENGVNDDFRNVDIENFRLTCEYLIDKGYYIFRMGQKVSKPLVINNKKFIDYASLGIRDEYLDIFLSANCNFFLSTSSGLDSVAEIFDRPIVFVDYVLMGHLRSSNKKHLSIFKHFLDKISKKKLTLSKIFARDVGLEMNSRIYEKKNIIFLENNPQEIKTAVIEMLDLIENNFVPREDQQFLQNQFWELYKKEIKKFNYEHIHGKLCANIGYDFLVKNKNLLQ